MEKVILSSIISDMYKATMNRLPSFGYVEKNKNSIAKRVRKTGVLQFPMIMVDTLSLEEATMISKAVERQNASWVAIITSMNSITSASNPEDYIKSLHNNIQPYVNDSSALKESTCINIKKLPLDHSKIEQMSEKEDFVNSVIDTGAIPYLEDWDFDCNNCYRTKYSLLDKDDKQKVDNILSNNYPNKPIYKHYKLNSLYIDKSDNSDMSDICQLVILNDNDGKIIIKEAHVVTPDNINQYKEVFKDFSNSEINSINSISKSQLCEYKPDLNMGILNNRVPNDSGRVIFRKERTTLNEGFSASRINTLRSGGKGNDKVFLDSDAKKANELSPTLMQVQTYFRTFTGELQPVNYIIGIKSIVHPISRDEIINFLIKSNSENNSKFLRFIKLTTGEISFIKDFVFTIDLLKNNFKEKVNGNPWLSKLSKNRVGSNKTIPNASLVLSMEEVSILKSEHGVDLTAIKNVQKLMKNYLFLSFIIADPGTETVYIFNDGDTTFSKFSYNALERENTNSAKDIKNIMNVLSRM